VWAKKASESKPSMTCRNDLDDIKTGVENRSRDEPGGCLPTGQAVSGMKVARAWPGLRCGTWEPVVPRPRAASGAVLACGRREEGRPRAAETARVEYRCGAQGRTASW
jgi:hypothetical protein